MNTLSPRKLLEGLPLEQSWDVLKGKNLAVKFDDGTITMSATQIIMSMYGWEFNKMFKTKMLKSNVIMSHYKKGVQMPTSHLDMLMENMSQVIDDNGLSDNPDEIDKLVKVIMIMNNRLYNGVVLNCGEYVLSASILDYIDLAENEDFVKLRNQAKEDNTLVEAGLSKATKLLVNDIKNKDGKVNRISWLATRKLAKSSQILQSVLYRGIVPELDKTSIPHAITEPWLFGMNTVRDYVVANRDGAVSLASTLDDLSKVSTDSRKLAYVSAARTKVIIGDCGSTDYINYTVKDIIEDQYGNKTVPNDLAMLKGSWMYSDEEKKLVLIKGDEEHLRGKTIKRRSQITCNINNPHEVCAVCMGRINETVPMGINVGADISKATTHHTTQSVMAIKHVLASLGSGSTDLSPSFNKFFRTIKGVGIVLRANIKRGIFIEVSAKQAPTLMEIYKIDNVNKLAPNRVTDISDFIVHIPRPRSRSANGVQYTSTTVKVDWLSGNFMLSYNLLSYLSKDPSLVKLQEDKYWIDISNFPKAQEILVKQVKLKDMRKKSDYIIGLYCRADEPSKVINEFNITGTLGILIDKIDNPAVSVSAIETILTTFVSKIDTYNLGKGLEGTYHSHAHATIRNRSYSQVAMWRDQIQQLLSPKAYLNRNRDDHFLDTLIKPNEVLRSFHRKRSMQ